jgi:hypothetical protein
LTTEKGSLQAAHWIRSESMRRISAGVFWWPQDGQIFGGMDGSSRRRLDGIWQSKSWSLVGRWSPPLKMLWSLV